MTAAAALTAIACLLGAITALGMLELWTAGILALAAFAFAQVALHSEE